MVDFLLIGSMLSVTYIESFDLVIQKRKMIGYNRVSDFIGGDKKFGNICWITNMRDDCPPPLVLSRRYSDGGYKNCNTYDCINIDRVIDIPSDYAGLMGVPLSFIDYWNPEQFELIGFPGIGIVPEGWKGMTEDFVRLYYEQGNTGYYEIGSKMGYFVKDGKAIIPYVRLLIKRK